MQHSVQHSVALIMTYQKGWKSVWVEKHMRLSRWGVNEEWFASWISKQIDYAVQLNSSYSDQHNCMTWLQWATTGKWMYVSLWAVLHPEGYFSASSATFPTRSIVVYSSVLTCRNSSIFFTMTTTFWALVIRKSSSSVWKRTRIASNLVNVQVCENKIQTRPQCASPHAWWWGLGDRDTLWWSSDAAGPV